MASYISSFITWLTSRPEPTPAGNQSGSPPPPAPSNPTFAAPTSGSAPALPTNTSPLSIKNRWLDSPEYHYYLGRLEAKDYPPPQLVENDRVRYVLAKRDMTFGHCFFRSSRDVTATTHMLTSPSSLLRTRLPALPPHVASQVLEAAQYYYCIGSQAERGGPYERGGRRCGGDADFVYLTTRPIRSPLLKPVRRIAFELSSGDQGWSDLAYRLKGTYEGCNSWLEVSIRREAGRKGSGCAEIDGRRWLITENVHAKRVLTRHLVFFESGHEMLDLLRPGDRLEIRVRTRYQGWVNVVSYAKCWIMVAT